MIKLMGQNLLDTLYTSTYTFTQIQIFLLIQRVVLEVTSQIDILEDILEREV